MQQADVRVIVPPQMKQNHKPRKPFLPYPVANEYNLKQPALHKTQELKITVFCKVPQYSLEELCSKHRGPCCLHYVRWSTMTTVAELSSDMLVHLY